MRTQPKDILDPTPPEDMLETLEEMHRSGRMAKVLRELEAEGVDADESDFADPDLEAEMQRIHERALKP